MLDPIFEKLIAKILKIESAHIGNNDDKAMYSQEWEFIFGDHDQWVVLNLSSVGSPGGYWLYPRLCPNDRLDKVREALPDFNFSQSSAAYQHVVYGDDHKIEPEYDQMKSPEIQLFFNRTHYGHPSGEENYVEFNQLITHPLDLHWSPRKNAYCRVDEGGEEVERIKIIKTKDLKLILIRRKTLDKLLYLGDWSLVRYFEFNRRRKQIYEYKFENRDTINSQYSGAIYSRQTCGNNPINFIQHRGGHITEPISEKDKILSFDCDDEEDTEKKYASYIVQDIKNNRILKDYSIEPNNFANYFTESELPFEVSPIFFNSGVLDKYKTNPDKYDLKERTISCRGGWYLQSYDINEYNQVHTYAVYLARLPFREQLYWQSFNEEPKGGISKRSIQTDFQARFPDEEPALTMLKNALFDLQDIKIGKESVSIWEPKGGSWENASKGLFYLTTENQNQWHDFIISLANSVTEGLQKQPLKKIANDLGNKDNQLGTLGLIKFILVSTDQADTIQLTHTVLNELQKSRGQGKAHGNWIVPSGSLIEDATKRLEKVTEAIIKLKNALEEINHEKT